jgi:hypothetical protein
MMRYFSYNGYITDPVVDPIVVTKSEEDIRNEYWPYWYELMCKKYGKDVVDSKYCFEDCLEDFIVVNWAWESDNGSDS